LPNVTNQILSTNLIFIGISDHQNYFQGKIT